jgi:hypothetical protein
MQVELPVPGEPGGQNAQIMERGRQICDFFSRRPIASQQVVHHVEENSSVVCHFRPPRWSCLLRRDPIEKNGDVEAAYGSVVCYL